MPHVVPLMQNNRALQYFHHDNARPYAAIPTQLYLDNAQVEVLKWPAKSPDMSPIEHLWDELGRRVYGHNVTSKAEFEDTLIAEYNQGWSKVPSNRPMACKNCPWPVNFKIHRTPTIIWHMKRPSWRRPNARYQHEF